MQRGCNSDELSDQDKITNTMCDCDDVAPQELDISDNDAQPDNSECSQTAADKPPGFAILQVEVSGSALSPVSSSSATDVEVYYMRNLFDECHCVV